MKDRGSFRAKEAETTLLSEGLMLMNALSAALLHIAGLSDHFHGSSLFELAVSNTAVLEFVFCFLFVVKMSFVFG